MRVWFEHAGVGRKDPIQARGVEPSPSRRFPIANLFEGFVVRKAIEAAGEKTRSPLITGVEIFQEGEWRDLDTARLDELQTVEALENADDAYKYGKIRTVVVDLTGGCVQDIKARGVTALTRFIFVSNDADDFNDRDFTPDGEFFFSHDGRGIWTNKEASSVNHLTPAAERGYVKAADGYRDAP